MVDFTDCYWTSRDGLRLHYRDYAVRGRASAKRPPVLCLPGLTRNARDFEDLALHLSEDWRVICPDMRGRGDSAYAKDSATYNPVQYVEDVSELLTQAELPQVVVIGTSLGALMAMLMAMTMPDRIAAAVLNDAGPVIETAGLERISGYVGQARSFPTWMHAARAVAETQSAALPDYSIADWLAVAKRIMVLGSNGRVVFDYDMKIAEPLAAGTTGGEVNLWPGIDGLAGKPVLLLRGALSDLLSPATLAEMEARLPGAEAVTVPGVGHAPSLAEPAALAAIERLLARAA